VLELDEGPLFVSYPVGIDAATLREGMVLTLQWTRRRIHSVNIICPCSGPWRVAALTRVVRNGALSTNRAHHIERQQKGESGLGTDQLSS